MIIAFRVDGSSSLGLGHVARCISLAKAAQRRGSHILFLTRALDGNGRARIEESGFPIRLLCDAGYQESGAHALSAPWAEDIARQDAAATLAALEGERPDWLIADHYGIDAEWERQVRPHCKRLLVIDDLANRPHDCDALLDQNVLPPSTHDYADLVPETCLRLLGPDYALLGPDYEKLHGLLPEREQPVGRIVVNLGGADPHDLTFRVVEAIGKLSLERVTFDIVVSLEHPNRPGLVRLAEKHSNLRLHQSQNSLAPLFAAADLAVGAGGVSLWERCCLGLPTLVITSADNQIPGTRAAHSMRIIEWVGHHDEVDARTIAEALRRAVSWEDLAVRSRRARHVVDGKGAARIAAMIAALPAEEFRLRLAAPRDELRLLAWANDHQTRAQSFSPGRIDPEKHHRWFHNKLRDIANCRMFIAELPEGVEAGQVRFDLATTGWEIDYSIEPALRGRGLGGAVLARALEQMAIEFPGSKIIGQVKPANVASRRIFESLGFQETASDERSHSYHVVLPKG